MHRFRSQENREEGLSEGSIYPTIAVVEERCASMVSSFDSLFFTRYAFPD